MAARKPSPRSPVFRLTLRKNGRQIGAFGPYQNCADAKADAQALAPGLPSTATAVVTREVPVKNRKRKVHPAPVHVVHEAWMTGAGAPGTQASKALVEKVLHRWPTLTAAEQTHWRTRLRALIGRKNPKGKALSKAEFDRQYRALTALIEREMRSNPRKGRGAPTAWVVEVLGIGVSTYVVDPQGEYVWTTRSGAEHAAALARGEGHTVKIRSLGMPGSATYRALKTARGLDRFVRIRYNRAPRAKTPKRATVHRVKHIVRAKAQRNPRKGPWLPKTKGADEIAAQELYLFIKNDGRLYEQQYLPIIKNLLRKAAKYQYDPHKAVRLFAYLVESGAKRYEVEFGSGKPSLRGFDRATRDRVAVMLAQDFTSDMQSGTYAHIDLRTGRRNTAKPNPWRNPNDPNDPNRADTAATMTEAERAQARQMGLPV